VQKIVAWNDVPSEQSPKADASASLPEKEARVFHVLAEDRGPSAAPSTRKTRQGFAAACRTHDPAGKTEMLGRTAFR
jgi:hypothetical protein